MIQRRAVDLGARVRIGCYRWRTKLGRLGNRIA